MMTAGFPESRGPRRCVLPLRRRVAPSMNINQNKEMWRNPKAELQTCG